MNVLVPLVVIQVGTFLAIGVLYLLAGDIRRGVAQILLAIVQAILFLP